MWLEGRISVSGSAYGQAEREGTEAVPHYGRGFS